MRTFAKPVAGFTVVALSLGLSIAKGESAPSLDGRWDATVTINGAEIPFRVDISGEGSSLKGILYNGDQPENTTSASFENGTLVLNLEHYLTKIEATVKDGQLEGEVHQRGDESTAGSPFHAKKYVPATVASADVPSIDGLWIIPHDSPKGEKAWRFVVQQSGPEVSAAILRVDGDTGALTGTYHDGKFVLSHFDGSRPILLEVTPEKDGTLAIQDKSSSRFDNLTAYRPEVAREKGLPEPSNFTTHTTVKDPNQPFVFSFPDASGKIVSNTDPQFKNKVVLAIVTGTWCPNCHDEAQYLVKLYRKYHDKGLEIVALDFEEPEQQDTLSRERAFIKQYGVQYTYLIAGAPAEMWEKVPQAVNLNTWPATFFIGRDGRVKLIHSGFAAPASGEFNRQLQAEFTSTIERLLAENNGQVASASVPAKLTQ